MTPLPPSSPERVVTTLTGGVPDLPPVALSLAMQAGRTSGRALPELLTDPGAFVDAQLQMHDRWQHDIAIALMYGAAEAEAFGADVLFFEDGPPNAGAPVLQRPSQIECLEAPAIDDVPALMRTLDVVGGMKSGLAGHALVAGVCIGPLSGPVMLMGMPLWLETIMMRPDHAARMVDVYRRFAIAWARAQIDAGADALIWFEPLFSPSMVPHPLARSLAQHALAEVVGLGVPVVLHLASARATGAVESAVEAGVAILSAGRFDDPNALTAAADGRLTLLGPLDGVSMVHWSAAEARAAAHASRANFDRPGGWIASDAHGEIPWNVDPSTLDVVMQTLRQRP